MMSKSRKMLVFQTYKLCALQTAKQKFFHWPRKQTTGLKLIKAGDYSVTKIKGRNFSYVNQFWSPGVNRTMSDLQQQRDKHMFSNILKAWFPITSKSMSQSWLFPMRTIHFCRLFTRQDSISARHTEDVSSDCPQKGVLIFKLWESREEVPEGSS